MAAHDIVLRGALCALFLVSTSALAAPRPWMKRDNPDTLGYNATIGASCPEFDIDDVVRGVFIRAQVTPLSFNQTPDLFLDVVLECGIPDSGTPMYIYALQVNFRTHRGDYTMVFPHPFGIFGREDRDGLRRVVRERVEDAMTSYVEAQARF